MLASAEYSGDDALVVLIEEQRHALHDADGLENPVRIEKGPISRRKHRRVSSFE